MLVHNVPQQTPEWYLLRCAMPTASCFNRLVTSDNLPSKSIDSYALELAANKMAGADIDGFGGNRATQRGNELEDEARKRYQLRKLVITEQVGFCTDNMKRYGCSPDDFVGKDGSVEYKCKLAVNHAEVVTHYLNYGAIPNEYYAQPQGVMFVTGRKWCDLVFYHPKLPGIIVRQYPNKDFQRVLRKQLKAVEALRNRYYDELMLVKNLEESL